MKAVLPHALEFYPMQAADLDAVAQIEAGIQAFPWSRGNFADSLHAGYSAWVARLPDRLIGFSVVMQVLDEAHILTIGICGSLQGQGYGARLLQHALRQVTTHGARRLLLEVRPSNARAVARLPDRLIGFSVVMQVLDEAHILTIGICGSLQGQGYGARLLQHAMRQVTTHGARRLLLEVRPSNARAVALYRNFGFQQIGVRKGYYPATEGREDGLVFQKELA